jgi:hypothetical protein
MQTRVIRRHVQRLGIVAAAALVVAPSAPAAVLGEQRVLVVRATWGPAVPTDERVRRVMDAASAFVRKSSFGKTWLRTDISDPISIRRLDCASSGPAFYESRFAPLRAAARAAGSDLSAWGRIVYVVPSSRAEPGDACRDLNVGRGNEVLVMGELSEYGVVHELGHTWGLGHARSADCRRCRQREYGDGFSVMGRGADDFSAFEKVALGWISNARTARRSGTYSIATPARPSARPYALVVPTPHGQYWIEHRRGDLLVRLLLRESPDPAYRPPTLLIGYPKARKRYCERGALSARIVPRKRGLAAVRLTLRPRRC